MMLTLLLLVEEKMELSKISKYPHPKFRSESCLPGSGDKCWIVKYFFFFFNNIFLKLDFCSCCMLIDH